MPLSHKNLNNPEFRREFCLGMQRECEINFIGPIPDNLLKPNQGVTLIGNYPGYEGDSVTNFNVLPAVEALVVAAFYLSNNVWDNCRLLATGRKNALKSLTEEKAEIVNSLLVNLIKQKDGKYVMEHDIRDGMKIKHHIEQGGVLWSAIGQTTERNGLNMNLDARVIANSYRNNTNLGLLAIETAVEKSQIKPKTIKFGELAKPTMSVDETRLPPGVKKQNLERYLYLQVGLYALAVTASMLPPEQRGDFREPELTYQNVAIALTGLTSIRGVKVDSDFISQLARE